MTATQPVSNDVLAVELAHLRTAVDRLLTLAERNATREEVHAADAAIIRRMDTFEGREEAQNTRIRALEDERTGLRAVLALVGFLGIAGVAAIVRWMVAL